MNLAVASIACSLPVNILIFDYKILI